MILLGREFPSVADSPLPLPIISVIIIVVIACVAVVVAIGYFTYRKSQNQNVRRGSNPVDFPNDNVKPTSMELTHDGAQEPRDINVDNVGSVTMETHYMALSNHDNNVYQPLNKERVSNGQSNPNGCYGDDHGSHGDYQSLKKINDDDS
jgi:hypothetical protein